MDFDLIDNQLLRQQMIDMTNEQWNYNWLILNEQNGLRSQTDLLTKGHVILTSLPLAVKVIHVIWSRCSSICVLNNKIFVLPFICM